LKSIRFSRTILSSINLSLALHPNQENPMTGLFNSAVLDVAIGLAFVYLLLAIMCTAANEWIATLLKARPKLLKEALLQLLDGQETGSNSSDDAFVREFYKHPLVTGMMRGGKHPAYLSAQTFTAAVTDIVTAEKAGAITFTDLQKGVNNLPEGDVKKALQALLRRSGGDLEAAYRAIEAWFDDAMDRVTGWFKRNTQIWTVIVAVVVTVFANADTVQIAHRLWTDPVLRNKVVAEAQQRAKKPPPTVDYPNADNPTEPQVTASEGNTVSEDEKKALSDLLGWPAPSPSPAASGSPTASPSPPSANPTPSPSEGGFFATVRADGFVTTIYNHFLGWLLTILAISLGAPFWFDLLNKFVNIRSAGKSPAEKPKPPDKKTPDVIPQPVTNAPEEKQ
jgi:hypothetical protein